MIVSVLIIFSKRPFLTQHLRFLRSPIISLRIPCGYKLVDLLGLLGVTQTLSRYLLCVKKQFQASYGYHVTYVDVRIAYVYSNRVSIG